MKKIVVAASCMLMFMAVGCQKEELETEAQTQTQNEAKILPTHCSPYRVVLGSAMMAELTTLANCELKQYCPNNLQSTLQSSRFVNPVDNSFYGFQTTASISMADQLTILQAGQNFAAANIPAGYTILRIEFKDIALNPNIPDWFNVYVVVTYRKCL